jgi:hypothetical protein
LNSHPTDRRSGSDLCFPLQQLSGERQSANGAILGWSTAMIRKLKSGQYRLYSRKVDDKTRKRRNLGTFDTRAAAEKHEREVQYFKRH